ncbi:aminotransferase class I/II-fold pyridoxal phosphate-dependent enzyme [Chryseobacterium sp.]|uniref:aminotransferase class I/II-fold pyridoxal phosphate-dependent enzyme n=1 Tax=Chryseobacterium sp. TaxID=1871047 RepID=UPI002899E2C7|nr:aminotransferase class I/II-fold pyridoxal phosphate-dependent enzyme [Chryseobacterium sp.]
MKDRIWLSSPHLSGNELKFVERAFHSNWVTSIGENIDEFEHKIQNFLGNSIEVCALNSATSCIHLALKMLGVSQNDEVLTSTLSFVASANPILYCNAKPVFIGSEPETWNMCPKALRKAIENRISKGIIPKAIIVVHLYGMPAKMDELMEVANEYNIPVIEDAAEALGSAFKNQPCGTFGHFGILSFNGNKIITTSGGGALICHSRNDKDKAIFLSTQARDQAPHYQHSQIGYNYRMSNIVAGVGCAQIEVLNERIEARRKMHDFYLTVFKDIAGVKIFKEPSLDYFSNHWLSVIIIDENITNKTREHLRLAFLENNIESRPVWKPMHLQPLFLASLYFGDDTSENLFENGLCLPSGSNLTDEDRIRIENVIRRVFLSRS